jgi:hypothetical protein
MSTLRVESLPCRACEANTKHDVLWEVKRREDFPEDHTMWTEDYFVGTCRGCETISFFLREGWHSDTYLDRYNDELVDGRNLLSFPRMRHSKHTSQMVAELPDTIKLAYTEAIVALREGQKVLPGIGLRLVLEVVCKDQSADGRTLYERIEALRDAGHLTEQAASVLHSIRVFGNEAAHDARAATPTELEAAVVVIENLLQNIYVIPAKANLLKKTNHTSQQPSTTTKP